MSGRCDHECIFCESLSDEERKEQKEDWNCEGGGEYIILENNPWHQPVEFDRCPASYCTREVNEIFWLWSFYRKGCMPDPTRGPSDQDAGLIAAFRVIDGVRYAIERLEQEEEERRRAAQANTPRMW